MKHFLLLFLLVVVTSASELHDDSLFLEWDTFSSIRMKSETDNTTHVRMRVGRILLGTSAAILAGLGYYYNYSSNMYYNSYIAEFDSTNKEHLSTQITQMDTRRSIMYSAAAGCLVVLSVSFAF